MKDTHRFSNLSPLSFCNFCNRFHENNIGSFIKYYEGGDVDKDEILIAYKKKNFRTTLGAESFFFHEGDASLYKNARYGELKVDAKGNSILVGLRDSELRPLGNAAR